MADPSMALYNPMMMLDGSPSNPGSPQNPSNPYYAQWLSQINNGNLQNGGFTGFGTGLAVGGTALGGTIGGGTNATPSGVSSPPSIPAFSSAQYPTYQLPTAQQLQQNDPGYAARFQMGMDAIQRSAAAQGSLLNGGTLKALSQYGQDYASNEYNNYVQQTMGANALDVNHYNNLYQQYQDLITNNRNANNDYNDLLLNQEQLGIQGAGQPPTSAVSNV